MNKILKKLLTSILCLSHLGVYAATPNNYTITNTSQINYSIQTQSGNSPSSSDIVSTSSVSVKTVANSPININLGRVLSNSSSNDMLVGGSCINSSGNTQNLNNPNYLSSGTITTPTGIDFINETNVKSGDPLFIKIFDLNSIKNPTTIEKINVIVTNQTGDKETIILTETAPSSGIFIGYVQTIRSAVIQNDCQLSVSSNDKITVTYSSSGISSTVTASVLVDPLGKIFDSNNGELINNARITLIDTDTGLPAKVYGDDGVSDYPNTMLSGSVVNDASGNSYTYGAGEFRFPLVKPGNYKVVVVPPTGYSFPSKVDDAILKTKFPNYTILTNGSKGLTFPVVSSIVYLDIPVDKRQGNLVVNKTASTNVAALGDFVQYTVTIQNTDKNNINNVTMNDVLPKGFKLKNESVAIDNIKIIPTYDGKTLQYNLGNLTANQTKTIKYVTQISMNSDLGNAVNYVTASGSGSESNVAKATVMVKDDLLSDKAIIFGNVYETEDCNRDNLKPVEGIKIQFETGDYVFSDKNGRWHLDGLKPMTHVAKIDKLSLPKDYYPVLCEANTRFAQDPNSQFVETKPSSIERVDFYIKKKSLLEKRANAKELSLLDLLGGNGVQLEIKNSKTGEKSFKDINKAGTEALSLNDKFMNSATQTDKVLFPEEKFNPPVPAVGFAVQTKGNHKVKLTINDKTVNEFNFDGTRYNHDKSVIIYYWRGIPLRDGKNTIVASILDEDNKQINSLKKELYFTTNITEAHFVPSQSKLKANGKDPIEIAVRFIDEFGHPAHKGLSGTYELSGNYTPFMDRGDGLPLDMLNTRNENKNQYVIGEDGLAIIKLMPSNVTGEMTLRFNLKDQQAIVRPWITADNREWILVGIAEGTKAANHVLNHSSSSSQKGMEIVEDNQGRIAFYGKGTIKGDYLLTMAYDNRKDSTINQGVNSSVSQEVYSVYGDSTIAQKDAESAKRIYIRIEKDKFYAMFGNYQTNLSVTDLTRFDRNLTGLKSEYKGENFNYNVFAAKTATLQQKEELKTDGTSGPYRTANPIVIGSETVTLVLRNKNQRDQIISSKTLSRNVDYSVDYDLGIITLKESPNIYDIYFNPYYIHVEYNTLDNKGEHTVMGGRVAYTINPKTEIGLTVISDEGTQTKQQISGVDLQYKDNSLVLKMETALSSNQDLDITKKGEAYNVEAQYQKDWGHVKVYTKKVDPDFGVTSALPADVGIQKTGGDLQLKLSEDMSLKGEAVAQKDLKTGSTQTTTEVKFEKKFNESFTGYIGERHQSIDNNTVISNSNISSSPTANGISDSKQENDSLLVGGEYRFTDIPLKLNGQINYTENPNLMSPKKFLIGSEYAFNNNLIGVADKQFNDYGSGINSNINRVGLKYKPWTGGQIQSYVGNDTGMTPNKFYQFGIDQNIKYNLWSFDLGFAKQTWDKQVYATQIPAGTLITQDNFNSYNFGATYRNEPFVYQFKAEQKTGSLENKTHLTNNIYRKIDDELSYSVGQDYLKVNSNTTNGIDTTTENIKGGLSYRGKDNTIFGRIDWINQNQNNQNSTKYVLNIHDNYKPNYDLEVYSHLGYKYVVTTFDKDEYKGSSYLFSGGIRKYLNKDWDIGVQGLYAASPSVNTVSKGYGLSVGYNLFKNAWVSVGYQKLNSYDRNYSFDDSYINGWFIKFRFKFDEETFHLNKPETATLK